MEEGSGDAEGNRSLAETNVVVNINAGDNSTSTTAVSTSKTVVILLICLNLFIGLFVWCYS